MDVADVSDRIAVRRRRRTAVRDLGTELTPEMIQGTISLCAAALPADLREGVRVAFDLPYGAHERHVLDVYAPEPPLAAARPVLLFVHGGGFVAGGKGDPGGPFFANIGGWAVRHGMVAVAMNYRLAPETQWPGGGEDVAAAVQWARQRIAEHGGDPGAIFVVGQSAGASHVADYLALIARGGLEPPAGVALISCLYDVANAADVPIHRSYWGDDRSQWPRKSIIDAVVDTDAPLFLAVAEHDQSAFHAHAVVLAEAWFERRGTYPPLRYLPGENHLSTVYGLGAADDTLGPLLEQFVLDTLAG